MDLKTEISLNTRTSGDGIDCSQLSAQENINTLNVNIQLNNTEKMLKALKPVVPKSKIIHLIPKYVPKEKKQLSCFRKPREPKFIPYEPYKAAVEPIVPNKKVCNVINQQVSKNNVEIQELVDQMSEIRAYELNKTNDEAVEPLISVKQWEKEKAGYEADIRNLRESNSHLENQLKLQSQVNSELKTLLVAAVGEDLETRVQHLTQDKLQLARALLSSADRLTSHQEQTEWLSGQCEVWRSKFLASSLMVEELARWKSALTLRVNDLQQIVKKLLEERKTVQHKLFETNRNLEAIVNKVSSEIIECPRKAKSYNIVDLSVSSKVYSDCLCQYFKCKAPQRTESIQHIYTLHEKSALKLLQNPVVISEKQEAICNALLGVAVSCSEQSSSGHESCCSHCKGEMKTI